LEKLTVRKIKSLQL